MTNYSVNKYNANFIENQDASQDDYGSKWSLTGLKKHLRKAGINEQAIFKKIDDIIIKTILSIEPLLN